MTFNPNEHLCVAKVKIRLGHIRHHDGNNWSLFVRLCCHLVVFMRIYIIILSNRKMREVNLFYLFVSAWIIVTISIYKRVVHLRLIRL